MVGRSLLVAVGTGVGVGVGLLAAAAFSAPLPRGRFELSTELEARVTVHQDLVTSAGRSPEDFCKLTADTVQILRPVVVELARFGGSEQSSVPFSAIQRAYLRTERLVPGLSLVATEQFTQTGIDYRWLAKIAPPDARAALRAMDRFEAGAGGVVSWGVPVADYSVCQAPERGRPALAALVKSWPAAPLCLRDALRERLTGELERMVGWNCFCAERTRAQAAVLKSAGLLKSLADVGGAEFAARWVETANAADTRFNCRPD